MAELIKSHRFRRGADDPLMCSVCGRDFGLHSLFPDRAGRFDPYSPAMPRR